MFSLLLALIYLCFVSLGLPDSLLGSAWPTMRVDLNAPVALAGILSMTVSICTIVSSLFSDYLTKKFGAGVVTATSIAMTAGALLGYSISTRVWMLFLWAIPFGFGAGGVDAALNNYVALHFKSRHMSWLHCMWGIGATISPSIMSFALFRLDSWNMGYMIVSIIQIALSVVVFVSLPLWKKVAKAENAETPKEEKETPVKALSVKEIAAIPGAFACFITFFCYCALEQTTFLWASSYMVKHNAINAKTAAGCASLFFIGITVGRAINGFLTMKWTDRTLIRLGQALMLIGIGLIALPQMGFTAAGMVVIGLGCAPVYPCIIHMTPTLFGRDKSQAMIGVQMAFAYTGSLLMPPLFGLIAEYVTIRLMPLYLLFLLVLMVCMHETVAKKTNNNLFE